MKIFFYILIILILIILIILFLPTHVIFEYDKELAIKIKIMGFKFKIAPGLASGDKTLGGKKASKGKGTDSSVLKIFRDKGVVDSFKFVLRVLKILNAASRKVLRRTTINEIFLEIKVCGDDAADTALKYGKIQSGVNFAAGFISSVNTPKKYNINIYPDFTGNKTLCRFYIDIYARAFFIIYEVVLFIKEYAKIRKEPKI